MMLDEYAAEYIARQRIADLRRSAAAMQIATDLRRQAPRHSWREVVGVALVRLGHRLLRRPAPRHPRLVRRPAA
jgi:hypothetical protein